MRVRRRTHEAMPTMLTTRLVLTARAMLMLVLLGCWSVLGASDGGMAEAARVADVAAAIQDDASCGRRVRLQRRRTRHSQLRCRVRGGVPT